MLLAPGTAWRNVLGSAYWLVEKRCLESYNLESGNLKVKDVVDKLHSAFVWDDCFYWLNIKINKDWVYLLLAPGTGWRNVLGYAHWLVEKRCLESYNLESGNLMVKDVVDKLHSAFVWDDCFYWDNIKINKERVYLLLVPGT